MAETMRTMVHEIMLRALAVVELVAPSDLLVVLVAVNCGGLAAVELVATGELLVVLVAVNCGTLAIVELVVLVAL